MIDFNVDSGFMESIGLESSADRAFVLISVCESTKDAKDDFKFLNRKFDNEEGAGATKIKLENFGDECYIWPNFNKDGGTLIRFREGKVVTDVSASSVAVAKRFARHVLERIPAI